MEERNKRIAKNTMMLYIRTFITMIVGLYTGRVMLEALGIDNYGIQNVVGGIVAFSSLIVGTTAAASSRYITYALGEGNLNKMRNVFTTVANVQIAMGFTAVVFLEIGGVWFLNCYANIPEVKMVAANWVLQCSILTTFIGLVSTPYNACIIAHERMSIYAWMSIIDAVIKLAICYIIMAYNKDRLILYSTLLAIVQIVMTIFYAIYSRLNFEEVRYQFKIDKALLKEMASYSGWNLFGNTVWILNTQGINMLINVFFGVAYNAARGVATTVNGCVQGFVNNFTTAFTPQITKSYAAGDYSYCYRLVNQSSKITWFLMYVFIVPVCIESKTLLSLWLVKVPPMADVFLCFTMFESLAVSSSQNLFRLIQANGNVKRYTVEVSLYGFMVFPLTWIAYRLGAPVWSSYPIFIFIYFTLVVFRFKALERLTTYNWNSFVNEVFVPCIKVSIISFIIPLGITYYWAPSILRFFVMVPISVLNVALTIYIFGLSIEEKIFVKKKLQILIEKYILRIEAY